jgi:uncharacterized protein (DUF433 family)
MVATCETAGIGTGLYTPYEAARFAKLRPETFNRWFYGDNRGGRVLRPRFGTDREDRLITFVDLIQALTVRVLRTGPKASKITLQHIRDVVQECGNRNIQFPLAREHTLYWYSNRLILKTKEDEYVGLTPAIDKDQIYSGHIIEPFLKEIQFGEQDKLAHVWTPLRWAQFTVELNDNRRFGMPTIEPGGILVSALVDAVESEGSEERAADAFDVRPEAVSLALKYQEYLQSAA